MSAPPPSLSIVVPAYDEAACIGDSLRTIASYLERRGDPTRCEIVVVDDGSRDDTAALARAAAREVGVPTLVVRCARQRGKGAALRAGFATASGERVLFSDADLSTPIESADALLAAVDAGADVAIGSRKRPGARVEVHQPWWRESMGKVFTALVRLAIAPVSDATCGFKAFRGDAGRALFSRLRIDGWSFDAELLFLATRDGLRVREVPVVWRDRPGTKVRLAPAVVSSAWGLVRIRANSARGLYERPAPPIDVAAHWSNRAAQAPGAPE